MVRTIVGTVVLLFVALPAFAQEDFPRVEMSLGYANLAYPCCSGTIGQSSRHSGFASTQGLNMTKNLGIENYFAYYGLGGKDTIGSSVSMIANIVGAQAGNMDSRCCLCQREDLILILQQHQRLPDGLARHLAVLRRSDCLVQPAIHQQFTTTGGSWSSGWNLSTGIVFALSN